MKILMDRSLFGSLLEDDIKTAINETNLKELALHNITLNANGAWRQYDHLIILPNKLVIIEAKSSTSDIYEVTQTLDTFTKNNKKSNYNTSVVQQARGSAGILYNLIRPAVTKTPYKTEPVSCIRAKEVRNKQTILPVYTDTTLWYFLKSLESELTLFDKDEVSKRYFDIKAILLKYTRTQEEYHKSLNKQNIDTKKTMLIDHTILTQPKQPDKTNPLTESRSKRETRLHTLTTLLTVLGDTLPEDAYSYALKYPTVPIEEVYMYLHEVERFSKAHPQIKPLLGTNEHLIDGKYIITHCKERGVHFPDFLTAVLETYCSRYTSIYESMLTLQTNPNKPTSSNKQIPKVNLLSILQHQNGVPTDATAKI